MTMDKMHIFLVEDDLSFGAVLKSYLEIQDFHVTWVNDGNNAISEFKNLNIDLCLIDVMLPGIDGFTIAGQIKKIDNNIPFVFLTAKTLKEDIVKGYKLGADDYITKPFDTDLLLYKIKAILKRGNNNLIDENYICRIGKYIFNYKLRQISDNENYKKISPKEADLLKLLCEHKNKLLPRETALNKIWGEDGYFTARSMDVFITKLRKYLSDDSSIRIKNIHGSGFLLEIDE